MTLGSRLKELREKRNLTVSHVAKAVAVSPSTYRDWEYGRVIKGEPYIKLAEIFEVSLTYLMTGKKLEIEEHLAEISNHVKLIKSFL